MRTNEILRECYCFIPMQDYHTANMSNIRNSLVTQYIIQFISLIIDRYLSLSENPSKLTESVPILI